MTLTLGHAAHRQPRNSGELDLSSGGKCRSQVCSYSRTQSAMSSSIENVQSMTSIIEGNLLDHLLSSLVINTSTLNISTT